MTYPNIAELIAGHGRPTDKRCHCCNRFLFTCDTNQLSRRAAGLTIDA